MCFTLPICRQHPTCQLQRFNQLKLRVLTHICQSIDRWLRYIRRAQSVDNTSFDLNSENSVKRCVQLSPPSSHQPSKRSVYIKGYATRKIRCGRAAIKGGGGPTGRLRHAKMLLVPISFFPLLGRLCSGRFYIFTGPLVSH